MVEYGDGRGTMGIEDGGRKQWYWVCPGDRNGGGVVAVFGWMFSTKRHLEPYTRLYAEAGWDSLVCHPPVLNLWCPSRAAALAVHILDELAKEVLHKPRPIVFATFSGGAKACLYKVMQILQGTEAGALHERRYDSVRACVAGQIHDSSPVDFVSFLGARFVSFTISQKSVQSSFIVPAMAQAGAKILDALFLPKFEIQRAHYWLTLKNSSKLGPILFLCSTNDDLAPYDTIKKFADTLSELGCEVDLVVWDSSNHVGHLRNFPEEYRAAVKAFLKQQIQNRTHTALEGAALNGGNIRMTTTFEAERHSTAEHPINSCRSSTSQSSTSNGALSKNDHKAPSLGAFPGSPSSVRVLSSKM